MVPHGAVSCTEEWNGTSWSTGGALITARYDLTGAGNSASGVALGGFTPGNACRLTCTEHYT
jgi:hypothetical protein